MSLSNNEDRISQTYSQLSAEVQPILDELRAVDVRDAIRILSTREQGARI